MTVSHLLSILQVHKKFSSIAIYYWCLFKYTYKLKWLLVFIKLVKMKILWKEWFGWLVKRTKKVYMISSDRGHITVYIFIYMILLYEILFTKTQNMCKFWGRLSLCICILYKKSRNNTHFKIEKCVILEPLKIRKMHISQNM